tara:strand:+ start:2990 stop:4462 length:1473 start_codon:yes stop_codon:yes gene_type:complete
MIKKLPTYITFFLAFLIVAIVSFFLPKENLKKGVLVNDISRMNPTYVKEIVSADSIEKIQNVVKRANKENLKVSMSGTRHSQGGHAFYDGAILLDMTGLNKIISLDTVSKIIHVQSGVTWAQIQEYINPHNLAVRAMQSSNIFTVGGSMSSNVHGRDPRNSLIVETIEDFRLILATGELINVSRNENKELFSLVIGGYGLFGIITDVRIRLKKNNILEKQALLLDYKDFPEFFRNNIMGDPKVELFIARPSISSNSFLRETIVNLWKTSDIKKDTDDKIYDLLGEENVFRDKFFFSLSREYDLGKDIRWYLQKKLVAQVNKKYFLTRNNSMRPPTAPLKFLDHISPYDSDIIQEYFIPIDNFVSFLDGLRVILTEQNVNLLGVTIRYVPKNSETFLTYGKKEAFSVVVYSNQELSDQGLEKAKKMTMSLVDLALDNGGIYYLTYQKFYTKDQMKSAYPEIDQFFAKKLKYDPKELFINKFYNYYSNQKKL